MHALKELLDSNVVRTILTILGIVVSVTIYRLNKKKKELSYEIVRNNRLFQLNKELKGRVEIKLDGKVVQNLFLAIIDIANTGNEPIKKEDFDKPLTLKFGDESQIISARVLGTKPDDLGVQLAINTAEVVLDPLLLNSGDGISLEVIMTAAAIRITHSARIVGVPQVRTSIRTSRDFAEKAVVVLFGAVMVAVACLMIVRQFQNNVWIFSKHVDISIMLGFGVFFAFVLIRHERRSRRPQWTLRHTAEGPT